MRTKHLIIGMGKVGKALSKFIMKDTLMQDVFEIDKDIPTFKETDFDIIHICFPYSEHFVDNVHTYLDKYRWDLVIIHSTVYPGTSDAIQRIFPLRLVVYSPIRGQHNSLDEDMERYSKFYSCRIVINDDKQKNLLRGFLGFFEGEHYIEDMEELELIKLWDTTMLTFMIAWAQAAKMGNTKFSNFQLHLTNFGREIDEYTELRPSIFPGVMGGTCIRPNLDLLITYYKQKEDPLIYHTLKSILDCDSFFRRFEK